MRFVVVAALLAMTPALVQCAPDRSGESAGERASTASAAPSPPSPRAPPTDLPPRPADVRPVSAADLGSTWRPGCPVTPDALRRVELDYWGFDGQTHRGQLVVHQDLTDEVVEVFAELHRQRFPVEKIQTVDRYPAADDELSMRDNNTSAFNCRDIPGTGRWSLHAYGRAIDVNPKLNPYIDSRGGFQPANAGPWVDRATTDPGTLHDGDGAVRAFTERGWRWGGHWRSPLDYQHFEMR